MKLKKYIVLSGLIALAYFVLSVAYFFGGLTDPISESTVRRLIEYIIIIPALIIYGVGYNDGSVFISGLGVLVVIWGIFLLLTVVTSLFRKA